MRNRMTEIKSRFHIRFLTKSTFDVFAKSSFFIFLLHMRSFLIIMFIIITYARTRLREQV